MKIKYYSGFIIFLVAWVLISEIYVLHMENFQSEFPYMTFYRPKQISQEVMLEEIRESANENSLKIFLIEPNINSFSSKTINVYSTSDIENELKNKAYVSSGSYNSFFLGSVKVCYKKWLQIKDIDNFSTYYYVGKKADAIKLKKELVDKYGGRFPQAGYVVLNYKRNVVLVWAIAFSFLILLSIYEKLMERKIIAIRVLMGESSLKIAIKSFLLDIAVFGLELIISQAVIGLYGNTVISNKISYFIFIIFVAVDFLLYTSYLNINFQISLKNKSSKGIFLFSYGYKIIIMSIFVVLISGCIDLIFQGIDYYKQKDFFVAYNNYSYSKIELEDFEQTSQMRFKFYNNFFENKKTVSLNQLESYSGSEKYIYADSGAVPYLKDKIPKLKDVPLDNKVYFLFPQGANVKEAQETWEAYYSGEYDSEKIQYTSTQKIISTFRPDSLSINSSREGQPVIILNNMKLDNKNFINPYLIDNSMYNVTQKEWNDFLEKNKIDKNLSCLTNVYENYQIYWKQNRRLLVLGLGVFILLLLLEFIITNAILHYEYQNNAVEIVLKKILGYSFFRRYGKIIVITLLGDAIGMMFSVLLLFNSNSLKFSFVGAMILCSLEIVLLIKKTMSLEAQQISKILKGGVL